MASNAATLRGQLRGLKSSVNTVYRFRGDLASHWRLLVAAGLCSVGYSAARLAEPWPLKVVFDNVLGGMELNTPFAALDRLLADDRMRMLIAATIALLALALLRGVFYYYQRYLTARVGQTVVLQLRQRLFAHLQRLSLSFHSRRRSGELLTRLTGDINMLRELLVASLLAIVAEGLIMIGFVVVMFLVEWRVALVAVAVIPLIFTLTTLYSVRIRAAARKQRRREGEVAARLNEALASIHVVQLFAREDEEDERLRDLNRRSLRSDLTATRLEARLNRSVELSIAAATAAALWFGATQVIAGRLTTGELVVFLFYLQGFYRPLRRISRVAQRSAKASVCIERVTGLLAEESDVQDGRGVAPRFRGEIHFANVHFGYDSDGRVLNGVHLIVEPGETLALVGMSGAGKSTLLSLVPRLYDPSWGTVRIDGHDVREYTLRSLRNQLAVVPQETALFAGTIRDNIVYGALEADDERVEEAARAAFLHDFIETLPDGYETVVGERGVTLSGGQRQRLAVARALVREVPIVLLDEPMTGLDAESEELVLRALDRLLAGRTALVVAHRLATVRRADLIAVLDRGCVAELGTHAELLARGGLYRAIYDLQFAPFEHERMNRVLA
jgi:ATP-binding cassette, subfamily B, bacterial